VLANVAEAIQPDFLPQFRNILRRPVYVWARAMWHDHDVCRNLPVKSGKGPLQAPFLVVALEQDHVGTLAHSVDEVGFRITQTPMHGMRLDNDRPLVNIVQQHQKARIAVADATIVVVFVEAVFVLDVNREGIELLDFLHHWLPPVPFAHVDDGKDAFSLSVRMANDQNVPPGVVLLDEFAGLFAKHCDAAQSGRITGNHDDRLHFVPSAVFSITANEDRRGLAESLLFMFNRRRLHR